LTKGDIARLFLYHIRQAAARVAKLVVRVHLGCPLWEKGSSQGSATTIQMSDCDHFFMSNHSAAICQGMSPTLKSTGGWSLLAQNLGRKRSTNESQIECDLGDTRGCRMKKKSCQYILLFEHNDRQTNRPRNGNIDRNTRNRL